MDVLQVGRARGTAAEGSERREIRRRMGMDGLDKGKDAGCAGCADQQCGLRGECDSGSLRGRQLGAWAVLVFLCPIVLALVGALCLRGSGQAQLAGAGIGFAVGTVASAAAGRRMARGGEESVGPG